ncbi:hypothetical protein HZA26_03320 [Candidatus Nomurabacteria bacterium]|nr:hypothetical protein [Candidatus Nomurabacteria bacterium]
MGNWFSGLLNSKKKDELFMVFDIGSSSVGGALFLAKESGIPEIILSVRENIVLESELNPDRFLLLTIKALETVIGRLCLSGMGAPKQAFCVLSSPWYASQTRIIKFKKDTPFSFTEELANELIQKEMGLFKQEHLSNYMEAGNKVVQIEIKNMNIMLNGYGAAKPLGQKAKELEMMIFVSMSGDQVLQKIEEAITRHFHLKKINHCSFIMSSYVVTRDLFSHHKDFLLVDIGGEMTDISLIKKEVLSESASFPLGNNFMIRKIASTLKCSLGEAKSLFSLYIDGHADLATEKKLESIMTGLKEEWLKSFQETLTNLSKDISIPSTVFITIDQELAPFFSEIIRNEQFNQYVLTEEKFNIILMDTKTVHGLVNFKGIIPRDPFLSIEAIYINRFLC